MRPPKDLLPEDASRLNRTLPYAQGSLFGFEDRPPTSPLLPTIEARIQTTALISVREKEVRVAYDAVDALRAELAHRTGVFLVLLVACVFVLTQRIQQLKHRLRLREGGQPPHPWW